IVILLYRSTKALEVHSVHNDLFFNRCGGNGVNLRGGIEHSGTRTGPNRSYHLGQESGTFRRCAANFRSPTPKRRGGVGLPARRGVASSESYLRPVLPACA